MTVKKIYLDMDGVLCDFEKKFTEYYGKASLEKRDRKEWSKDWQDFILDKKGFEKLEWFPGGRELLSFLKNNPKIQVEILSSSGGEKYHGEVTVQKIKWLKSHGIHYKANIVPGRKKKAEYATSDSLIIDDTPEVIRYFTQAGGQAILHKDIKDTLKQLDSLLNK